MEDRRAQQEKLRAERERRCIGLMSWLFPATAFATTWICAACWDPHESMLIMTAYVVSYSSVCSFRTWVNYREERRVGLLVSAIIGTLFNLTLLPLVSYAIFMVFLA